MGSVGCGHVFSISLELKALAIQSLLEAIAKYLISHLCICSVLSKIHLSGYNILDTRISFVLHPFGLCHARTTPPGF